MTTSSGVTARRREDDGKIGRGRREDDGKLGRGRREDDDELGRCNLDKSLGAEGRMTTSSGVTARRGEDDTTGRTTTSSGVTARRRQDKSSASAAKMTSQRSREVPAAPHQGGRREIERGAAGPRGRRRTSTVREDPYLKFTEQDLVGEETN
jgi:hypothetical protein